MDQSKTRRKRILILWMLAGCLLLSGCATIPPQPITGMIPTEAPTEAPASGEAVPNGEAAPDMLPTDAPAVQTQQRTAFLPANPSVPPTQVELFYSGAASLMGFADASQTTIYENTMDALPATVSLCWPAASVSYYRYGSDIAKTDMNVTKEQLLAQVGNPSFYRDTTLAWQPARLKREGEAISTEAENMNEPINGFYDVVGKTLPSVLSNTKGTPVAVAATDPAETSLSIIITDLHELRMDDGALLNALNERCLQVGRTVGLAAITSEFSGLIPDVGPNNTTFVWGDMPSGTLDYMLNYGEYSVGISIDPEHRKIATRPFYILVIGDQGAVETYLAALEERLTNEFAGNSTFLFRTAVFGNGYVPVDYTIAGNMRYLSGQGVTAIAEPSAPAGVSLIELKASQQARYLEWELDYKIHPSDPRGTSLTKDDFTFIAEAVSGTSATVLPNLSWQVKSTSADAVTLSLRLELPQGVLPQGSYTLALAGSLTAPPTLPGTEWLSQFGYDADGTKLYEMEQNTTPFDGGKTLFLSRLVDTLGRANLGRLGVAPLGTVQITLTVYA